MRTVIVKEFLELMYNPKFLLTFAVSTALILLCLFNGYSVYDREKSLADQGNAIAVEDAKDNESYDDLGQRGLRISREPDKLSIFDQGLNGVIGSKSQVSTGGRPRIYQSRYSVDPVLAVFGELDLTFTVSLILSLFAILFSYNSISGEREAGTLRLIAANPASRVSVILGKLIGGFLPLALLFVLPFLLGVAGLLFLTGISFTGAEWARIGMIVLAAVLYLLVFYTIGLATSSLTRNSFVSFLLCLFVWVLSVAIIPRIAVRAADFSVSTTSVDELESNLVAHRKDLQKQFGKKLVQYFDEHPTRALELGTKMGEAMRWVVKEIEKQNMEFEDKEFSEFGRQRKSLLHRAMLFSRASPTSCYSFAVHALADSGPTMSERFEEDLLAFRRQFAEYLRAKEEPPTGGLQQMLERIGIKSFGSTPEGFIKLEALDETPQRELALDGMPRFDRTLQSLPHSIGDVVIDLGLLALYAIAFFALAFVAFLRYDVR